MQHALRHRGPDDRGTWQSPSRQATFGHTRLAILDLSPPDISRCRPPMAA